MLHILRFSALYNMFHLISAGSPSRKPKPCFTEPCLLIRIFTSFKKMSLIFFSTHFHAFFLVHLIFHSLNIRALQKNSSSAKIKISPNKTCTQLHGPTETVLYKVTASFSGRLLSSLQHIHPMVFLPIERQIQHFCALNPELCLKQAYQQQ